MSDSVLFCSVVTIPLGTSVRLHKSNQQLKSTIMSQRDNNYFNLNSLWMAYENTANYEFGLTYVNGYDCEFEDCHDITIREIRIYMQYICLQYAEKYTLCTSLIITSKL